MAIELLGDSEAMTALGLGVEPTRERPNRPVPAKPQNQPSKFVQTSPSFVREGRDSQQRRVSEFSTVNIPDIRYTEKQSVEVEQSVRVETAAEKSYVDGVETQSAKSSPQLKTPSQRTLSSLQAIKNSIERQSTGEAEQVVDDLFRVDIRAKNGKTGDTSLGEDCSAETNGNQSSVDEPASAEIRSSGLVTLPPKADGDCYFSTLQARDRQIQPIAQNILEKFAVGGHSVIAFAGTERNEQLESVVVRTALELAEAKKCRVLIIDSDVTGGHLTHLMRCGEGAGLTDLSRAENSWESVLQPTCKPDVHFLPLGKTELPFPEKLSTLMKKVTPNFVGQYDYVIVNVGDAHGAVAKLWSNHTNGTFLVVSMTETNQNIAKSAVAQLNSFGARLIGCVVSDVES